MHCLSAEIRSTNAQHCRAAPASLQPASLPLCSFAKSTKGSAIWLSQAGMALFSPETLLGPKPPAGRPAGKGPHRCRQRAGRTQPDLVSVPALLQPRQLRADRLAPRILLFQALLQVLRSSAGGIGPGFSLLTGPFRVHKSVRQASYL